MKQVYFTRGVYLIFDSPMVQRSKIAAIIFWDHGIVEAITKVNAKCTSSKAESFSEWPIAQGQFWLYTSSVQFIFV